MKNLIVVLIISLVNSSCCTDNNMAHTITPTVIGYGSLFGAGEENIPEQNIVITNMTEWDNLKTKMNITNNTTDSFNETGIDFSTCKIIASFDQIRNYGGFTIDNTNIIENEYNIIINIQHFAPNTGNVPLIIEQPFKIIRIPKIPKPIVFN
jgi:hypothetical protein